MYRTTLSLILAAALAAPLAAQAPRAPGQASAAPERRVLTAAPLTGQIHVDGKLDEEAWAQAQPASDFTQAFPSPGQPASERTEVRVIVGPDALYVGARMLDSHPDSIAAQLSRRDVFGTYSDAISVQVDSRDDRRTAFAFGVNPRGVKTDSYQFDDVREDQNWDAVWDVATSVDSLGWTAEFRIPFSQLRFAGKVGGERVWGLGIMRDIARRDERDTWSPWTRNSPGFVSSFGELRGLADVRAPARLEIRPYTSARMARAPGDAADPFYRRNDVAGSAGADFQYGLPAGLTLTGTVNPDFGQVEVDPAVVNLTAFETFFPERRPFFVEGSDVFRFGDLVARNAYAAPQYFYSRRIGRVPQGRVTASGVEYVDVPDQTTILGAAKVSGKTADGWSIGLLDALTGRERAQYLTSAGVEGSTPVEPLTNYMVGRVRRDLNQGRTVVGGIVTATNRSLDSVFTPFLRSSAYVAGLDAQHSWGRREWTVSGFLAGSRVQGSANAILNAQLSSARYFQRPEADYVAVDPSRTALGGHLGGVALAHSGRWDGSVAYQEISPGFEVNDLGFQGNADRRSIATYLGKRVTRPGRLFRSYNVYGYTTHAWNFGGDNVYADVGAAASGTLRNFWSIGAGAGWTPSFTSDRLTRGGPLAFIPAGWNVSANVQSDRRKPLVAAASGAYAIDNGNEFDHSFSMSLSWRPSTNLQLSFGPSWERGRNTSQFVTARPDSFATATFGRRYVFADVDQTTLALNTRVNWTFTPNLSLELFAQPFVSSGNFDNYKEFLRPGTYDFGVYGKDYGTLAPAASGNGFTVDPDGAGPAAPFTVGDRNGTRDFTFRSLRGNAVLRWEYRPGSTLFFVWQQLRSNEYDRGTLDFGRDFPGIFREPAENVFVIKATYWLGR
jgi:hypothetical protein